MGSIRLTGLPVPWALFLWHVGSIFLVLLGCWKIASACFESEMARWSGVLLVTTLLTMPIAGTALFLVDTYLHPRALAAGAILLALAACLEKRWITTAIWLVAAGLMHPLMALFGASLIVFAGAEPVAAWQWPDRPRPYAAAPGIAGTSVSGLDGSDAEPKILLSLALDLVRMAGTGRSGIAGVVVSGASHAGMGWRSLSCWRPGCVGFAVFQFVVGALMTIPAATEQLSSLQPMRWLHIFYFLFLLMAGGLIGQFLLRAKTWRWLVLFLPLAGMMFYVQRASVQQQRSHRVAGPGARRIHGQRPFFGRVSTPQRMRFSPSILTTWG